MGTLSIILGLVILVGFSGFGYILAELIMGNPSYQSLLGLKELAANDPLMVFVIVIGVCAFIGLLICMGMVMNGLIYNRMKKVNETVAKLNRSVRKLSKGSIEE